jgi:hypothetical protein
MALSPHQKAFDLKTRTAQVEHLENVLRPRGRTRGFVYGWPLFSGPKNSERTPTNRTLEALHDHMEGLSYLADVMAMLPKPSVHHNEGGAILVKGWQLNREPKLGANFIRKLRLHTEKIVRFLQKVEKEHAKKRPT